MVHAVIIYSVGSPDTLSVPCLKQYLNRFLSDKLVVKLPRFLWQPILQNIILRSRPERMISRYAQIFVDGQNPYLNHMDKLAKDLEFALNSIKKTNKSRPVNQSRKDSLDILNELSLASTAETPDEHDVVQNIMQLSGNDKNQNVSTSYSSAGLEDKKYIVRYAYAFCEPSLETSVKECLKLGANRITTIPLFPQYSDTTSLRPRIELSKLKNIAPECRFDFVPSYCDDIHYIKTISEIITEEVASLMGGHADFTRLEEEKIHILISYHSLPNSYIKLGDPYLKECMASTEALISSLHIDNKNISYAFQSRMGPMSWLKPDIEDELDNILNKGKNKLIVIAPGFSIDCLETLYDLDINLRNSFLNKGGESFHFIPGLNASPRHVCLLRSLIHKAEPVVVKINKHKI